MKKNLTLHFALLFLPFFFFTHIPASKAQSCSAFYDGFESGTWSPTWLTGTGIYTRAVTTTSPAVGSYSFEQTCTTTNSFYEGTYTVFTPSQPAYMSWWMKTNTTTGANGYVIIGNSAIASDNGIIFCYFNATSGLRFFNGTGYNYPVTANTWYHVEARNMNWTARNCDIYINGVLFLPAFAFRSGTAMDVDRIHLHSLVASVVTYDEFVIGNPDPMITPVSVMPPSCFGDSTGLVDISVTSGTGSYSYLWSSGSTTEDINTLPAGVYTVAVTDSLGCTAHDTFSLLEPAMLMAGDSTTDVTCGGGSSGSINLIPGGGTPGYSYLWSTGQTTEDLSGLMAGTYIVTVTDTMGCIASDTVVISEPSPIAASSAMVSPTCHGGVSGAIDLTISGGSPTYTFLWSNGSLSEDLTGVMAGTYTVTITDTLGCALVDTFILTEPAAISATDSLVMPACNGDANGGIYLDVSGGTPGYTYLWSNGATTASITALAAGAYDVSITDSLGCTVTSTYTLNDPPVLSLSTVVTAIDTGLGEGAIDLTPSGGTPPYTYLWSNGDTSEDPTSLTAGPYTVTVTDANGCTTTDSVFIDLFVATTPGTGGGSVNVWPNPFAHEFFMQLSGIPSGTILVSITDIHGREVWRSSLLTQSGNKLSFSPDLPAGMYLVQVTSGENRVTTKLVKNQ